MLADKEKSKGAGGAGKVLATPQVVIAEIENLWAANSAEYRSLHEKTRDDKEASMKNLIIWMKYNPLGLPLDMIQSILRVLIENMETEVELLYGIREGNEDVGITHTAIEAQVTTINNIVALFMVINQDLTALLNEHWEQCKAIMAEEEYRVSISDLPTVPEQAVIVNQYLSICEEAINFYSNKKASSIDEANRIFEDFVEYYLQKIPDLYIKKSDYPLDKSIYYKGDGLMPIYTNTPTKALAYRRTRGKVDEIARTLTIPVPKNKGITIENLPEEASGKLGIGEHKMLSIGLGAFTEQNEHKQERGIKLNVLLDLPWVASIRNEDISTEGKLKIFRRKLWGELTNILRYYTPSWEEKDSYKARVVFQDADIPKDNSCISITFGEKFAQMLIRRGNINPYHQALMGVDERNYNAYAIGVALNEHYGIDRNVLINTEGNIKIGTLLKYTNLPSVDELRKKKASKRGKKDEKTEQGNPKRYHKTWKEVVKDPFDRAIAHLEDRSFFAPNENAYYYGTTGGERLTDEEVQNIESYEAFCRINFCYTLSLYEDRETRLKKIEDKKARTQRRRPKPKQAQSEAGKEQIPDAQEHSEKPKNQVLA